MPPVLSSGGGRSVWLSVPWDPASECAPSARTSCEGRVRPWMAICFKTTPTGTQMPPTFVQLLYFSQEDPTCIILVEPPIDSPRKPPGH